MKRRDFLRTAAAGAAATAVTPTLLNSIPLYAKTPADMLGSQAIDNDAILIIIQLFGGNDGLNTIIPVENDRYHAIRPQIRVPKNVAVRYANSDVYLHPALVNGINIDNKSTYGFMGLLDKGWLAVVQGIGYENPNLSHFRSTDIWMSGINSSDPGVRLSDGWMGRFIVSKYTDFPLNVPDYPLCIQVGGSVSLALQSQKGDTAIALLNPTEFFERGQGLSPDEDYMPGTDNFEKEFNFVRSVAEKSDKFGPMIKNAYDNGKTIVKEYYSAFEKQMGLVARLISGGLKTKVYMLNIGGFDTHVQQQDASYGGVHPLLLNTLAGGITKFMAEAVQQGFANRVVGMTVSEFGRRPYENGSRGTDHGAASIQFAFGTKVKGGIYGNNPDLVNFNANGDMVYQYDYRRVYAEVLQTWFGASAGESDTILNEHIVPLPILHAPDTVGVNETPFAPVSDEYFTVSPNPATAAPVARFELRQNATIEIAVYSMLGKRVAIAYSGTLSAGVHAIQLGSNFTAGDYICEIAAGGQRRRVPFSVIR
ncbi:DUF1501 domain-containing protein [Ignavibacteria bacterium]|nr:DUF1501 domain-containing protein [Bacteroidota bacterium]MCZ2132997.1 DUF1501 domain-containing protein [Bacteroidota bacterium]